MLQDPKMLEKMLGAFGERSHSNILTRFVVVVVGKCCFIQTKMSWREIVPLITFPWESFQSFWGQFISREGAKWEFRSSRSENRCFNGNNEKTNPFRGSVWKIWFFFHTGMKRHFQTSETFVEVHCWSLAASTRNSTARQRRGWHICPLQAQPCCGQTPPCLDFGEDIAPLLLLSAFLPHQPRSLWQCRTAWYFALLFSTCWNVQSGSQKRRKAPLDLAAAIWGRCNVVVAWGMKCCHQIKP